MILLMMDAFVGNKEQAHATVANSSETISSKCKGLKKCCKCESNRWTIMLVESG